MKIIEVAAGLVFHQGQLLITQRYAESHLGGLWEFPGGKVEEGETLQQCLVRELREELEIEVKVGQIVESLTHSYPEKTVRLHFYRCDWISGQPRPIGCANFHWVRAEQLRGYRFPAADVRLLDRLITEKSLWEYTI